MHRAVDPVGLARDDYQIFAALAHRLGVGGAFTEGRTPRQWLEHTDRPWGGAPRAPRPPGPAHFTLFERFRGDPHGAPLRTPSGRIEITSETIGSFGYPDCPSYPDC